MVQVRNTHIGCGHTRIGYANRDKPLPPEPDEHDPEEEPEEE